MFKDFMLKNLGGRGEDQSNSIYIITAETSGMYDGYGREPALSDFGAIDHDDLIINNKEYKVLGLFGAIEPDIQSLFCVNDYIDYEKYPVYIARQNIDVVYTINRVYADLIQNAGYIVYLLKPYGAIFSYDDYTPGEQYKVWIGTTEPNWN